MDVMAVGKAKELVEPLLGGQKLRLVAQMPLAKHSRSVTGVVKHFGDRVSIGLHSLCVTGKQHREIGTRGHVDAFGITARHHAAREGVQTGRGDIEAGQLHPFGMPSGR